MCAREIALGLDVNVIKANELVFMSNGPKWEGWCFWQDWVWHELG